MRKEYSHADLLQHIATLIQPSPEEQCPPEKSIILAGVLALSKDLRYVVIDDNDDEITPQWLYLLASREVSSWDGSADQSFGYGGINSYETASGVGLSFYVGGSGLQSAITTWIIPATDYEVAQYVM